MTRRIVYISGTRADFGLMRRTLAALHAEPGLSLSIVATGLHLSASHGETVHEIAASGLPISALLPVAVTPATGATMARGIATIIAGFIDVLETDRPDLVLLLGDRGEMLAGAIAAIHLNIAIAHVHGGERSGTVDEPVRHAITKLSHIHLAATQEARERLIRMGESANHVHVTGAPGVDGLSDGVRVSYSEVASRYGFDSDRPLALMVYHPVLQNAAEAGKETRIIIGSILSAGAQILVLMPNADAGSDGVRAELECWRSQSDVRLVTHLERNEFLDVMACVDVMVGNSSAGIIEAASFGTPVVNIGSRQNLRERNANVIDVPVDPAAIGDAVARSIAGGRLPKINVYGDGDASARIVTVLRDTAIDRSLMAKANAD